MKASDICVGDWLNIYNFPNDNPKKDDLFPAKVSAVSVFDPFKEPDDVTCELVIPNTNDISSRPLDTCLPIELTEDILVKNGFVEVELTDSYELNTDYYEIEVWNYSDGLWVVTVHWIEFSSTPESKATVSYAHQLQHLLRLCGVEKELAI